MTEQAKQKELIWLSPAGRLHNLKMKEHETGSNSFSYSSLKKGWICIKKKDGYFIAETTSLEGTEEMNLKKFVGNMINKGYSETTGMVINTKDEILYLSFGDIINGQLEMRYLSRYKLFHFDPAGNISIY